MHGAATTLNLSFPYRQSGKHKDGTNWVQQLFVCQGMPPCNHSFVAASLLRAFSSYQELQNHGDGAASSPPTPRLKSIVCEQNWITKKERPAFIKSLGNIKITVKWWKQSSCLMCLQQGDNYFNFHLSYLKVKCGNTNAFIHLFWSISTNPYQDFLKKKDWSIQKFEYVCTHSGAHRSKHPCTQTGSPRSVSIDSLCWQELPLSSSKKHLYFCWQCTTWTLQYIAPNLTQCWWSAALQCTSAR